MRHNPTEPDVSTYECDECGTRVESEAHQGQCPNCAGSVRNITVVRE